MEYPNKALDKKELKAFLTIIAHSFGATQATIISDKVKNLAFQSSTYSGASLSMQDFTSTLSLMNLIHLANAGACRANNDYCNGVITFNERHKIITISWRAALAPLTDILQMYMQRCNSLSSLYAIAFSGARGNITQTKQLVGMRGLIMDVQGKVGELPIRTNLFSGMTSLEIAIASHGSRKGLVDTGVRTADAGYLTRRLVDSAQDILVREEDCFGDDFLTIEELISQSKNRKILWGEKLVGRVLETFLYSPENSLVFTKNMTITKSSLNSLRRVEFLESVEKRHLINIRSPFTCITFVGICRNCYGCDLGTSKKVSLGLAVGVIAAQSIGEPGTQMILRTFHTGGAGITLGYTARDICCPSSGLVIYHNIRVALIVRFRDGLPSLVLKEEGFLIITGKHSITQLTFPGGTAIFLINKSFVYRKQVIADFRVFRRMQPRVSSRHFFILPLQLKKPVMKKIVQEHLPKSGDFFYCKASYINRRLTHFLSLFSISSIYNLDVQNYSSNLEDIHLSLWVLDGYRYQLMKLARVLKPEKTFFCGTSIARLKLINKFSGIPYYQKLSKDKGPLIINSFVYLINLFVKQLLKNFQAKNRVLHLHTSRKIISLYSHISNETIIRSGHVIFTPQLHPHWCLAKCGGIVYRIYENNLLLLLPEERYYLRSFREMLIRPLAKSIYLRAGTKITSYIVMTTQGILQINTKKFTLIIKPGFVIRPKTASIQSCGTLWEPTPVHRTWFRDDSKNNQNYSYVEKFILRRI